MNSCFFPHRQAADAAQIDGENYVAARTKEVGCTLVEQGLQRSPKNKIRPLAQQNIDAIRASNHRDFHF